MEYGEMKVAELRKLCMERGIAIPSKATKAQLVGWLEAHDANSPIEVEAVPVSGEVVPKSALAVDIDGMNAAAIALGEAVDAADKALADYDVDDETIDGMSAADIRICEDGIASALKNVDDRRKELTRLLTEPKKVIDAKVKEKTARLSEVKERYADARMAIYEKGYRAQYEECCIGLGMERLLDLVPYERFIAPHGQWVSRTANPVKTQEKIAAEVERIAKDWSTLRGYRGSMRFYDEAEREFFATLDINAALKKDREATAQQEKLDAARREREENERWQREAAERNARAWESAQEPPQMPVFEEVEPEPAPIQKPPAEPARAPQGRQDGRKRYHFEAWLDDAELASFREWKNACGIGDGWTFREVRNG